VLSYQHIYHAGNLADVHKHAMLAAALALMTARDKPMTYIETHAGRALYDLGAPEALRTGEAATGIARALASGWFPPAHPFARAIAATRAEHGADAYPGSPLIAAHLLRPGDRLALADLHPQEHAALAAAMKPYGATVRRQDGFAFALSVTPPEPRRGLLLIDPSYEVKADYTAVPRLISQLAQRWNVGVILLWYPILADHRHRGMVAALTDAAHPRVLAHEVRFRAAKDGHGMTGSGLFVLNPPFGLRDEAERLTGLFARA
jgi:23S rRNA (adenine2030-N6)-methyltransferase